MFESKDLIKVEDEFKNYIDKNISIGGIIPKNEIEKGMLSNDLQSKLDYLCRMYMNECLRAYVNIKFYKNEIDIGIFWRVK